MYERKYAHFIKKKKKKCKQRIVPTTRYRISLAGRREPRNVAADLSGTLPLRSNFRHSEDSSSFLSASFSLPPTALPKTPESRLANYSTAFPLALWLSAGTNRNLSPGSHRLWSSRYLWFSGWQRRRMRTRVSGQRNKVISSWKRMIPEEIIKWFKRCPKCDAGAKQC